MGQETQGSEGSRLCKRQQEGWDWSQRPESTKGRASNLVLGEASQILVFQEKTKIENFLQAFLNFLLSVIKEYNICQCSDIFQFCNVVIWCYPQEGKQICPPWVECATLRIPLHRLTSWQQGPDLHRQGLSAVMGFEDSYSCVTSEDRVSSEALTRAVSLQILH